MKIARRNLLTGSLFTTFAFIFGLPKNKPIVKKENISFGNYEFTSNGIQKTSLSGNVIPTGPSGSILGRDKDGVIRWINVKNDIQLGKPEVEKTYATYTRVYKNNALALEIISKL